MTTKEELLAAVLLIKKHCKEHDAQYCRHECVFTDCCEVYFKGDPGDWPDPEEGKDDNEEINNSVPTAEVRPVIHAHWVLTETGLGTCCICSNCGSCPSLMYKYCPYCGADMRDNQTN